MGVGFLKLNRESINAKHPDGQWVDEPQNSSLRFQFDPDDVKFSVHTKWEKAEKSSSFMQIPWKYTSSGSADPNTIDLTLHFDDRMVPDKPGSSGTGPSAAQWSAQRSAEILEAWATPIVQPTLQLLLARYEKEFKAMPRLLYWPQTRNKSLSVMIASDMLKFISYITSVHVTSIIPVPPPPDDRFLTQETTVQGRRMSDQWHGPRPLLLSLFTVEPIKCVLTALELEIIAIDTGTGSPLAIDAHITLEEWVPAELGNGLYDAVDPKQVLEEFKTILSWNKAVMSGKLKETVSPDWTVKLNSKGPVVTTRPAGSQ